MSDLNDLRLKLLAISVDTYTDAVAKMRDSIATVIEQEFATGTNPSGEEWAPLRPSTLKRGRHPPPLTATGTMRRGVVVTAHPHKITVDIPAPYASFHQDGTEKMAQRAMLPNADELPDRWLDAMQKAVAAAVDEAAKKL